MRDLAVLFVHLIATVARLLGRGGARSVVAESLLLKHQLLILNRSRTRAPNLRPIDRIIAGLCTDFMRPSRLLRSAIVLKPATIMAFHRALVKRKYRLLFTPRQHRKPGPKGPVFEFHRWKANLRILNVTEIKTVPEVPLSHPFIERLVGTIRRELLDQVPFLSAGDLERKLLHFRAYYNRDRVHASLGGATPACKAGDANRRVVDLSEYQLQSHCRGLYQLPMAA